MSEAAGAPVPEPDAGDSSDAAPERLQWEGPLPEPVRQRVVALASEALGGLSDDEVPPALKRFRQWAPARRTKLAGAHLASAVDRDVVFRQKVASRLRGVAPDLVAALEGGTAPPSAEPDHVAAVAYIMRAPDWPALVARAGVNLEKESAAAEAAQARQTIARLEETLEAARAKGRDESTRLREELAAARADVAAVRAELRAEKGARRRAEELLQDAETRARAAEAVAAAAEAAADSERRKARSRLAEAQSAVETDRRASREGRRLEDIRLRLLLDTVVDAASGLRRELALPPVTDRPADRVPAATADATNGRGGRALHPDDPSLVDQLLALPQVHLVVDGYNVTKTGYPDAPLEVQRSRLVTGLVGLAAQYGAEITCCFDGAEMAGRVPSLSGRGVRVLFSRPGETADELIRRLVRAEPPGRPLAVVSSDREVADGVRRAGARPVSAAALVRRLDRS